MDTNVKFYANRANQSTLLIEYVHEKIRKPLEELFELGQDPTMIKTDSEIKSKFQKVNQETIVDPKMSEIWSIKIQPVLQHIVALSESTQQKAIGVVGNAGSGKSSLINSIIDHELLPTLSSETCTAAIAAISSWKEKYYQLVAFFVSEEQWRMETDQAIENSEADAAYSDENVSAFRLKQMSLWPGTNVNNVELNEIPSEAREKMKKGYEVYTCNDCTNFQDQLNEFASMQGRWWAIVDKIYIRGPFPYVNKDVCLFDIPGFGDGYEALTLRAVAASRACDQLVYVVDGDGRESRKSSFLKGLLCSSSSTERLSLVVTKHNKALENAEKEKKKRKENKSEETLIESYRKSLLSVAEKTSFESFDVDSAKKVIEQLAIYYVENKCDRDELTKDENDLLQDFINKELNVSVKDELDRKQYDIMNNINTLLNFMSIEFSDPLLEIIPENTLRPLINNCLEKFSTITTSLKTLFENSSKEIWKDHFWSVLEKPDPALSRNQYDYANYQTLRVNLRGDYLMIARDLAAGLIDFAKIAELPRQKSLFSKLSNDVDLLDDFDEMLLSPLKQELSRKNAYRSMLTAENCVATIKLLVEKFHESADSALRSISTQCVSISQTKMRDLIVEKLWRGKQLKSVSGDDTKKIYLTFLHQFIDELNRKTYNSEFQNAIYDQFFENFEKISFAVKRLENDVKTILEGMAFAYKIEEELKEKILLLLVPLPLHFEPSQVDEDDQIKEEIQEQEKEIQTTDAKAAVPIPIETPALNYDLSNIHQLDPLFLAHIPSVYTTVDRKYVFYGYVYVLSNKAMSNLYKIGYTASAPMTRAKKLYTTGVPLPFVVEKAYECYNCRMFERWMHKLFRKHRVSKGREFFQAPLRKIIEIGDILERIMDAEYSSN